MNKKKNKNQQGQTGADNGEDLTMTMRNQKT